MNMLDLIACGNRSDKPTISILFFNLACQNCLLELHSPIQVVCKNVREKDQKE